MKWNWIFIFLIFFINNCSDKKTIRVIGESTSTIQAYQSLEAEYESLNPDIDLEFIATSFDDAYQKTNQDFVNGTGLYDIVLQYNFSLSPYVRNDYVYLPNEIIDTEADRVTNFTDELLDETWTTVGHYYANPADTSGGIQVVGYPYVANSMLLVYNKSMFNDQENVNNYYSTYGDSLRVPRTWEEYYQIAEFFTDESEDTYGVVMAGSGAFLYFELANYLYSMGGRVLDKNIGWGGNVNTEVILNSEASKNAFEYFLSLKEFNNGAFFDVEQFNQMEIMKDENTAMAISWEDVISLNIQEDSNFSEKFGFAPIPGDKSIIGGGAFFVNRDSEYPEEAYDFIIYALQPDVQKELALKGLSSPLEVTYRDEEVQQLGHIDALYKSLSRGGIYLEAGPDSDMISNVLNNYVQRAWRGTITSDEAVELAAEEIRNERSSYY